MSLTALATGSTMLAAGGIGLCIGSFIGAAAMRLPRGEGIVAGRSRCDACGRALTVRDLVPVVSFLLQRGRCRSCGERIDRTHFIAELGGASVGLAAASAGEGWAIIAATALFGWQLLLLALLDARHFWLPLRLIALLAATALMALLADVGGDILPALMTRIAAGALGFALLAAPALAYRALRGRDGLGAADPLLLAAIGLWLGLFGVVLTLLLAALAGLAAAVVLRLSGRSVEGQSALPLGTLMALSAFAVRVLSPIV